MNILKQLTEKPWLAQPAGVIDKALVEYQPGSPGKTALLFFIAVVTVIFFLFTVTYLSRSQYADFQALGGEPWSPLYQPMWLWMNTVWLFMASLCLQLSATQAKKQQLNSLLMLLTASVLCSLLFLFGQWSVWQQLSSQGFMINSNPANSYFYLLTAIHGLHLFGGLFALARVVVIFAGKTQLETLNKSLKLCAWYWHYLFLVWLFLFTLLTASPSTYNTIAAWCGL
ncbi:cytochrome c oxidase subunit 3 [Shewanella eurypsychrophilus]|uniref:Cytochrome c oxidase subunit 3 n=1 Tax=Shewanella eurypsychrophilus TaxID=2593656 RepID=A0ABX6VC92_9GAMM|nr:MULTISPECIES: cytochrome c oxidase subunit 3 [Shewanella]QFU25084.1 cytochrome oxidase subunit III [Shewanella sp. YLB-09]QPG60256.1 cytochrome c oxidase subunit 3 [Shewanella eurypsychrophilus]